MTTAPAAVQAPMSYRAAVTLALDLAARGRLSTRRLARLAGCTERSAALIIGDHIAARRLRNYGGTYVITTGSLF